MLDWTGRKLSVFLTKKIAFSNQIQSIQLYKKNIDIIDVETFRGLIQLFSLDLSFNQISQLNVGVFDGLSNLKE